MAKPSGLLSLGNLRLIRGEEGGGIRREEGGGIRREEGGGD